MLLHGLKSAVEGYYYVQAKYQRPLLIRELLKARTPNLLLDQENAKEYIKSKIYSDRFMDQPLAVHK